MSELCSFNIGYNIEAIGLNGTDFEFDPFVSIWGSWDNYDRVLIDMLQFDKSYIKSIYKKGQKAKEKIKGGVKKIKEKGKAAYKKGKEVYKKGKAQYKEEKQGVKEIREERRQAKYERRKRKVQKEEERRAKNLPPPIQPEQNAPYLFNDFAESSTEESGDYEDEPSNDDDLTDEYITEDENEDLSKPESEYYDSAFLENFDDDFYDREGGSDDEEFEYKKEIKIYKESKLNGPFNWPGLSNNKLRGDENLNLQLYIHTKHSGQPSIDKKEKDYVNRIQQSGRTRIPINFLFTEIINFENNNEISKDIKIEKLNNNGDYKIIYSTIFFTPKLAKIKANELKSKNPNITDKELIESIFELCTKAKIDLIITINNLTNEFKEKLIKDLENIKRNFDGLDFDKFMLKIKSSSIDYLPFGSYLHENVLENSFTLLLKNYLNSLYFDRSKLNTKPFYLPSNNHVENLHLAYYSTDIGDEPVIGFMLRKHKEFTESSEKYFEVQLIASLKRKGLSEESFIRIIDEQFQRKDEKIINNFLLCCEIVCNIGTFAASQVLYTSDFRYANDLYSETGKQVNLDSWDFDISTGANNSGDCEDLGSLAIEIINDIKKGRKLQDGSFGWNSPLLDYAKRVLEIFCFPGIASTVTDAFINSDGQKINISKIKDLPMINDETDRNSTVGGHFHGLSVPNSIVSKWIKNSNQDLRDITKELQSFLDSSNYKPWEYNLNILVLEGTGNIDPNVLPIKESFKFNEIELKKRIHIKQLNSFINSHKKEVKLNERITLDNHNPKELKIFTEILTPESQPFYIEKQDKNRNISKFFKDFVHGIFPEIYEKDNSFSQLVFCYKKEKSFGVNIGHVLRDNGFENKSNSNIMLIRPLNNIKNIKEEKEIWKNSIIPLINTIQNQQPRSIIGNYNQEETKKLLSKRIFINDDEYNDVKSQYQQQQIIKKSSSNINNKIGNSNNNIQTIIVTHNKNKSYIINNKENPMLTLEQGIKYKIKIEAEGHPFWILYKDKDNNYKPYSSGKIKNNGTDNGIIELEIPSNEIQKNLIYECQIHNNMTGQISIINSNELSLSKKPESDIPTKNPDITYKYKLPKWHFKDLQKIAENNNQTIMRFYTKSFYFEEYPDLLIKLENEINYLKIEKGIIGHVFYEQKFFPQCDSIIELLLICDVTNNK